MARHGMVARAKTVCPDPLGGVVVAVVVVKEPFPTKVNTRTFVVKASNQCLGQRLKPHH